MTLRMPGIPRVERTEYPLGRGRALWRVTHPDPSKVCDYTCCPFESETFFRTWREAVDFALRMSYDVLSNRAATYGRKF